MEYAVRASVITRVLIRWGQRKSGYIQRRCKVGSRGQRGEKLHLASSGASSWLQAGEKGHEPRK